MPRTISFIQTARRPRTRDQGTEPSAEQAVQAIFEGVAEGVLEATDEDILAEARELGRDPLEEAEELRTVLMDAVRAIAPEAEPRPQRGWRPGRS